MFHYSNLAGFNGIHSQVEWIFKAGTPPDHPKGAYFTTLNPLTPLLCRKLRIPNEKIEYCFEFNGHDGLKPIEGGRGQYIFFSATEYTVRKERQLFSGKMVDWR